jgi:hypothetical protein
LTASQRAAWLHGPDRPDGRRAGALAAVVVLAAAAALATVASPAIWGQDRPRPFCDANSPLVLLAVDTTSGEALVAVGDEGATWLRITRQGVRVVLRPDSFRLAGGFVGAGPLAVVANCGPECLQAYRVAAAVRPWGEAILAPRAAAVSATYDGSGAAWVAAVRPTSSSGFWQVSAFRRQAAGDWIAKGRLIVSDLEGAGLVPLPDVADSVAIGTGLFAPAGPRGYWVNAKPQPAGVATIPGGPASEPPPGGQILPLGGTHGAYVGLGGEVFFTGDRGARWSRSLWTPWGSGFVQAWRLGEHYSVELPAGAMSPLPLLWLDRRHPERPGLTLSLASSGGWRSLTAITADESFPAEVAAAWVDVQGNWTLLARCEKTASGSALRLRRWRDGALEPALSLPIE